MKIVFKVMDDGGFIVGDIDSGMTAYAFPSSPHALVAKRYPKLTAEEMISSERIEYRAVPAVKDFDKRNWQVLTPEA